MNGTHDPDEALERLLEGNARFVADRKLDHDTLRREELAAGQNPFAVIIGCADSRVPPEVVFDQGLGELFVVRVAGNTAADPLVVGSVEFALTNLGCPLVVVLGHQGCGAVAGSRRRHRRGRDRAGLDRRRDRPDRAGRPGDRRGRARARRG